LTKDRLPRYVDTHKVELSGLVTLPSADLPVNSRSLRPRPSHRRQREAAEVAYSVAVRAYCDRPSVAACMILLPSRRGACLPWEFRPGLAEQGRGAKGLPSAVPMSEAVAAFDEHRMFGRSFTGLCQAKESPDDA